MKAPQTPPDIFDQHLLAVRRDRAERRNMSFLIERVIDDIVDRLETVNRQFQSALIIGPRGSDDLVRRRLSPEKQPASITLQAHMDDLPDTPQAYDLVINLLGLHTINNLPHYLMAVRKCLKPDGLFIGTMFGEETLTELRQSLYETENSTLGGMSARVYPFATLQQTSALMQGAGFALPVVDVDRVRVSYSKLATLIDDIRDLGDTNCLTARSRARLPRDFRGTLEAVYAENFADTNTGKLKASFDILWLTGWVPDPSQPKALKPGSAKVSLAEGLRRIRDGDNETG
jgi:SAM-dependent methyltransferase